MRIIILLLLVEILFLLPVHAILPGQNLPTSGTTISFDDFTSSQFPQGWSAETFAMTQNTTQNNGYLTTTIPRGIFSAVNGQLESFWENNTGTPVYTAPLNTTSQGGFRQIVFKLQAFNLTNVQAISGGSQYITMDVQIGIASSALGGWLATPSPGAVWFDLMASTKSLSNYNANLPPVNQAVLLGINRPMASATNSYYGGNFPGTFPWLLYAQGKIDLSAMHIFTIQMELDKNNATNSWARWQVDTNGWMQVAQTACSCLTGGTGDVRTLFPFIVTTYSVGGVPPITVTQSLGSNLDYVMVTDFVPATLPRGQLVSSNINPPLKNLGIYQAGGFSLTQYIQFQANEIGQGNIYAGGLFLTGIFMLIITLGLAGVMWKTRMGFSVFGMIWNISTLAFIYLMYYTGVIPLLIPVLVTIGAAAIMFGIFRSGPPSMGGEVQS
jgi:hypothetical protein